MNILETTVGRTNTWISTPVLRLVTWLCPTHCDPTDCSSPGSSVHGILWARILEWVSVSSSRGSSQPRDQTQVSLIAGGFSTVWTTRERPFLSIKFSANMWVDSVAGTKRMEGWGNVAAQSNSSCFYLILNLLFDYDHAQSLISNLGRSLRVRIILIYSLSCVWLFCDPMDYSPPGSSVHGISQAKRLKWVAISFSRGCSWPKDQTASPALAGRSFTTEPSGKPKSQNY